MSQHQALKFGQAGAGTSMSTENGTQSSISVPRRSWPQKGLKPFDDIPDRAPDDKGIEWGPKFSETVSGARVDLKGGLS